MFMPYNIGNNIIYFIILLLVFSIWVSWKYDIIFCYPVTMDIILYTITLGIS